MATSLLSPPGISGGISPADVRARHSGLPPSLGGHQGRSGGHRYFLRTAGYCRRTATGSRGGGGHHGKWGTEVRM